MIDFYEIITKSLKHATATEEEKNKAEKSETADNGDGVQYEAKEQCLRVVNIGDVKVIRCRRVLPWLINVGHQVSPFFLKMIK